MSGGSFNYASEVSDLEDVLSKRFDLNQLRDRMYGSDIEMDDVAADLDSLLAYVAEADRRVTARLRRLGPVLHAVEWNDSGDWGSDRVRKAVVEYRGQQGTLVEIPRLGRVEPGRVPRSTTSAPDEAHLEESLGGRVTFVWVENMDDADAIRHIREMHGLGIDFTHEGMADVYRRHATMHPTDSHAHALRAPNTVIPSFYRMDEVGRRKHMAEFHHRVHVGSMTPAETERLVGQHQNHHDSGLNLHHEHRTSRESD